MLKHNEYSSEIRGEKWIFSLLHKVDNSFDVPHVLKFKAFIYLWKLHRCTISQGAPLSSHDHDLMLWNWHVLCFMSDFSLITVWLFSLIFYWELTDYSLILQRVLKLTVNKSLLGLFFRCLTISTASLRNLAFSTDFPRCIAKQGHLDLSK